jgi:acetyl-CoA C-acetyltransferase
MAKEWKIGRAKQDELAYASHMKATAAWKEGFYDDLVVPCGGLTTDNNVRSETSLDKLAKLKPAFDKSAAGTLTAGNSTPLTDGAACVLLASEQWAKSRGLPIQAYFTQSAVRSGGFRRHQPPARRASHGPNYAVPRCLIGQASLYKTSTSTKFTKPSLRKCSAP